MIDMYYNPDSFSWKGLEKEATKDDEKKYRKHAVFSNIRYLAMVQVFIAFSIALSVILADNVKGMNVFTAWCDWLQVGLIASLSVFYLFHRPRNEDEINNYHIIYLYSNAVIILFYGVATTLQSQAAGRPSVQYVVALILAALLVSVPFKKLGLLMAISAVFMISGSLAFKPEQGADLEMLIVNSAAVVIALFTAYHREKSARQIFFQKEMLQSLSSELEGKSLELENIVQAQLETLIRSEQLTRYLPPEVVDSILTGKLLSNKTEKAKITVFFSDIKDFTKTSDSLPPDDLARILNEYMTEMLKIARKHGATVDKFVGDAIMIFFGAPSKTDDRDHALRCLKMAIEMQNRMSVLKQKWYDEGIERPFSIRIGINTGECVVGNFGSLERQSYTAIGTQVNIAARLEKICDAGRIMISHATYALVKEEIKCADARNVEVKGITGPITVYEVDPGCGKDKK